MRSNNESKNHNILAGIISLITLAYRSSIFYSIYSLLQEQYYKTSCLLLVFQIILVGDSLLTLILSFIPRKNGLSPLKAIEKLLYYNIEISKKDPESSSLNDPNFGALSLQIKIIFHYAESAFLLCAFCQFGFEFQSHSTNLILVLPSILNLLLASFCNEFVSKDEKSPSIQIASRSIESFATSLILIGYFFIYINDIYYLCIFIVPFVSLAFFNSTLSDQITDMYISRHPNEKLPFYFDDLSYSLAFSSFLHVNQFNDEDEPHKFVYYLSGLIQMIRVLGMISFDLLHSSEIASQVPFRIILRLSLIIIVIHAFKIIKWFYLFWRFGPFEKKIIIESNKIENMSLEEIRKDCFSTKPGQKIVWVEFRGFHALDQMKRLFQEIKLLNSVTIQISQNQCIFQRSIDNSSVFGLKLQDQRFADAIFAVLAEDEKKTGELSLIPEIKIPPLKKQIVIDILLQGLAIHYKELIPKVSNMQITANKMFKPEIMRIAAFEKMVSSVLTFSPKQVYYDLQDLQ